MNIFNEANTIQAMLLDAAVINGWMVMDKEFVEIARKAEETKAALKKSIVDVEQVIKGLINR